MAVVKNLMVRAGADFSGLSRGINGARRDMTAMQRSSAALGGALSKLRRIASATAIIAFGKSCLSAASDLAEVQNVVDVTFGEMAGEVNAFAKSAITNFGMSETAAKQFTGTMGAMLKSMGLGTSVAKDMSMEIVGLAGDMASFYNLKTEEAFYKIRSGISGETEPLKQLGINMSVANLQAFALSQGIIKSYKSMTQSEQTLLRYNYLLSVTKDAQGDFVRTQDSWANQTRILSMQFQSLKASLGTGLIQALTPAIKVINGLMAKLVELANTFSAVTAALFGKQKAVASESSSAVESAAESYNELAGGISAAGKAAKNATSSIDELNVISPQSAGGGASVGGVGMSIEPVVPPETDEQINNLEQKLSRIKDVLHYVEGAALGVGLALALWNLDKILALLPIFGGAAGTLGTKLGTLASKLLIVGGAAALLAGAFSAWQDGLDWTNLLTMLGGAAALVGGLAIAAGATTAAIGGLVAGTILLVTGIREWITTGNLSTQTFTAIEVGILAVGAALAVLIGWPALVVAAIAAAGLAIYKYWDKIKQFFVKIGDWFGEKIIDPIANYFSEMWSKLKNGAKIAWSVIKSVFSSIPEWFHDKFTKAWTKVRLVFSVGGKIFDGIKEGIAGVFKTVVNGIIGGINKVIAVPFKAINKMLNKIRNVSILGVAPFKGFWSENPLSVPQIPKLAKGAVIPPNREFLAILGDQRSGTNIEAPLSTIEQALENTLDRRGGAGNADVIAALYTLISVVENKSLTIGDSVIGRSYDRYNSSRGVRVNSGAFANAY